jgi:hypothetical protein
LDTARDVTRQLDYYEGVTTNNYSKAIKTFNGFNEWWWLRSARSSHANCFFIVDGYGDWSINSAITEYGVSAAFRIG